MNTPDHEPTPPATEEPGSPAAPTSRKKPPGKLSTSTEAFIAQMAENLRTHDSENPKGRLRIKP